jgi:hypothetical protein
LGFLRVAKWDPRLDFGDRRIDFVIAISCLLIIPKKKQDIIEI